MEIDPPTWDQISRIAPAATIALTIAAIGYWAGWWSRGETIKTLKEWLDSLRKK